MKIELLKEGCYGCGLCEAICPQKAITMQRDNKGFWKPVINKDKCIECGLCQNNCNVVQVNNRKSACGTVYGVIHINDKIRKESTSGGAFSAFAETVIKMNGVIYGAAYDQGTIRHIRVENMQELGRIRGSKYAQSDIRSVYKLLQEDLLCRRKVLFSGTPCQCAAIKKFVEVKQIDKSGLYLVDFICHGIVSSKIFEDYIKYCEKAAKKKIKEHYFRSKINGWESHTEANLFTDGEMDDKSFDSQLFKSFFHSLLGLQKSCFLCKYTSKERTSDITMSDFWGIKESHPDRFDVRGVSMCIINSAQGKEMFEKSQDNLNIFPAKFEDTNQPQLKNPVKMPADYDKFWKTYEKGFYRAAAKYFHAGKVRRWATNIVKFVIHK